MSWYGLLANWKFIRKARTFTNDLTYDYTTVFLPDDLNQLY